MTKAAPLLRQKGIILRAVPYQEHHLILTVLTEGIGMAAFIAKRTKETAAAPLTEAEFAYTEGRSSLLCCREISSVNLNIRLREEYGRLQAACGMAQALCRSQLENKPAPFLYSLLRSYLNRLPSFPRPGILEESFRLKLLRHEGLLGSQNASIPGLLHFSEEEELQIQILSGSRSFKDFDLVEIDPLFKEKLQKLFEFHINH